MSASTGTTVAVLVGVLVVLGATMIGVAVWLVRTTRSDPQALGPLEVMGDRRWRRGDSDRQQTKLDTARPPGAPPPAPMVADQPAGAAGDGDTGSAEPELEPAGAGNGEPSMQESAVSAHSSPGEDPVSEVDAGDGDGDGEVGAEPEVEPAGAGNGEPSMQESAVSAHSSPGEDAVSEVDAGDGDGDGEVGAEPEVEPAGAGNGEPSMQESAVSAHSSPGEDAGGETDSDVEAATKE